MNTLEFASPPPRERRREAVSLPTDRLWTVRHAAAFLGRSESWVYKAAERGELPRARGMGWGLRFVPAELLAIRARREASGARGTSAEGRQVAHGERAQAGLALRMQEGLGTTPDRMTGTSSSPQTAQGSSWTGLG